MIIVPDSNEYINYLDKKNLLLQKIFLNENLLICINDIIIREVLRNIKELQKKELYNILFENNIDFYGQRLPLHLLTKYKKLGLKKGDISIAAFCENINADCLITENRHFLKSKKFDKFEVLGLKGFLGKLNE